MSSVIKRPDGLLLRDGNKLYDSNEIIPGGILRGEVEFGYDLHTDPITGLSSLGETVLKKHNEILLGGTIFALEKMFNIEPSDNASSLHVPYLNDLYGFGLDGEAITERYKKENGICLFNIGMGGCGNAYTDVKAILQQHQVVAGMIPFRVVDEPFTPGSVEAGKYWMMVRNKDDGKYWYYGKSFAKKPVIQSLWKNAGEGKDVIDAVTEADFSSVRTTPIETFAEAVLTIEVVDLREYFELYQKITEARFNSLGLCSGIKSSCLDGRPEYKQVTQFSALNFSNEMLHMNKDLSCIYRVYSA